jgi:Bor protein
MTNRRRYILFPCLLAVLLTGCFTQSHIVGDGPQHAERVEARQWYVLFGLVPINRVDSAELAEGADDYEVRTSFAPLDILISVFTGLISVNPMTVSVTR